jgi:cytochrome c-type biogenesis protein CcmE
MSKKTTRVWISALILGATFVMLLVVTMRGSTQYFKHVDEVLPVASEWYGKGLQLHGYVVAGSLKRVPGTLKYQFEVEHQGAVVTATYTGIVPDTFRDGAEVVLKGRLHETGFDVEPNGVVAKCPSKYEEAEGAAPRAY